MSKHDEPVCRPHPAPEAAEVTAQFLDRDLCLALQKASRRISRRLDDVLRPIGLTNTQFMLLTTLSGPNPPKVATVAAELGKDRTTVTAILKPLIRRDLVTATADPTDQRVQKLSLMPEGARLLQDALRVLQPLEVALCDALEQARPGESLRRAIDCLGEEWPDATTE